MIKKIKEWSGVIALIIAVLVLVGVQHSVPVSKKVGGTTNYSTISADDGVIVSKGLTLTTVRLPVSGTSSGLTTSTTTPCALQSPAATTTLVEAGINFTLSTSTAYTTTIAKATSAFATTTVLDREADIANGITPKVVIPWNTSNTIATSTLIFAPSQWVVFGMEGNVGTYSPTGSCYAQFQSF